MKTIVSLVALIILALITAPANAAECKYEDFIGVWDHSDGVRNQARLVIEAQPNGGAPEVKYYFRGQHLNHFVATFNGGECSLKVEGTNLKWRDLKFATTFGGMLWGVGSYDGNDFPAKFYRAKP
jgi:hypothetical protein